MKKNNFFIVALLGAGVFSGVSFEARGMETNALLFGSAVLAGWYLKDTEAVKALVETAKTYSEHNVRLAEEQKKSANPLLYAKPLEITGLEQKIKSGNERLEAYLKQNEAERNAYSQQTKKNEHWNQKQLIESYGPNQQ